ncbi:MAG: FHA domain-containing protein [Lachnospiraceae bacterium]|nr:FHA domain-containing protein [Lachnospiraceae bacterium]
MKKIIRFCLPLIILLLLPPLVTKAEGEKFKNDRCVVPFDLIVSCDGEEKYLRSSYGILVGISDDGGAPNIIANVKDVFATGEEIQIFCDEKAIEEDKRDKVEAVIKVTVEKDVQIGATINNVSDSMNLAVLNLEKKVYNHNSVLFDLDDDNIKPAQELYILDNESNYHIGYAVNESLVNGIKYVQFDSPLDWEQRGQAVFTENEEFVGMIQDSVDGAHKNALSSKEIAVVLKTLGIEIDVADHTVKPVDKQVLIAATDMADKLDLSLYTPETAEAMKEQIQVARSIIISEEATQEEVDAAYNNLNSAQDSLVIEEKMDTITIVLIIVSGVLALGIVIFVIVLIIINKRRNKKEKEKAELDAKRAPVSNGPYVPNGNKNKKETTLPGGQSEYLTRVKLSGELDKNDAPESGGMSEKLTNLSGFAPSSKAVSFNEEDTTVLSVIEEDEHNSSKILAHLVMLNDGKRIDIDKELYTLGKSEQKADFAIDNKSVSRAHLSIIYKDGKFYAKDLSSLNGSYLNNNKLNPQEEVEIKNEDSIKLADAEMKFYVD